jgi:hypothetical protein
MDIPYLFVFPFFFPVIYVHSDSIMCGSQTFLSKMSALMLSFFLLLLPGVLSIVIFYITFDLVKANVVYFCYS